MDRTCLRLALVIPGVLALAAATLLPAAAAPQAGPRATPVCPRRTAPGVARCHTWLRTDVNGATPSATTTPSGYGPADLQAAYGLTTAAATAGSGMTVAIVDPFDDPSAESDLAVYRAQFGLPPCTTANGCFRKVAQNGSTNYPRPDARWAGEISVDLDMVSAICPNCNILLVEANSDNFANLGVAVDTAAKLGANAINNSYGGTEYGGEVNDQVHYSHPGIAVVASTGDSGYGTQFPAASPFVTAVGGTSLVRTNFGKYGWTETAWNLTGSGCSQYQPKPAWQTDTGCAMRTIGDVAAVADPNPGVAIYDSFAYLGYQGWLVFGGTSVAAPIVSATYALAGNTGSVTDGGYPYGHASALDDITSGSNGTCSPTYLCTAGPGYDGPTGLGSPNGTGGF